MTLYGDAKVGKSYAAIQLACALSQGGDWLGFPIRQTGPVVYIQLDTPRSLWASRLDALAEAGLPVHSLSFADRETLDLYPFDILKTEPVVHRDVLREAILSLPKPPSVVIIDTLREVHGGDENDSTAMQAVLANLVVATQPAALILISHSRKPNADMGPSTINDLRGSNYVVGRMDAICQFQKRSIAFTGRAIEHGVIKTERTEAGTWELAETEEQRIAAIIVEDPAYPSLRAKSKALAARIDKSEEACRSLLRRLTAMGRLTLGHEIDPPLSFELKPLQTKELGEG